jgi:CRISPR-associated protein Cas2
MKVLVSYDVATTDPAGRARLRKVAKTCKSYGVRVQYSVFECSLGEREWLLLKKRLLDLYDPAQDSLRFYLLGEHPAEKTEHHGVRVPLDPDGLLLV